MERRMMNTFNLVGRVCEEPERFESANGVKVCRLRVSVEKNTKDENGYDIYEVALFRNLAEEKLEVGQCVALTGKLQANNLEKDGNTYYSSKLIGNSLTLLGA